MNIGIVTQPLVANYGGLLQNFALQRALEDIGCNPVTLDLESHLNCSYSNYLRLIARLFVKKTFFGASQNYPSYNQKRPELFDEFVRGYIKTTSKINNYSDDIIRTYQLDGLIVGSDQVWRPRYNVYPEDMFLSFAEHEKIKRISYAASFGDDAWEYSSELTERSRNLISRFDAISVRESSGVNLCKKHLNVDAVQVLDPTLLHDASIYDDVCKHILRSEEKYIAVYALGLNDRAMEVINRFAHNKNLTTKFFTSDANYTLSVPEWLAMIRDAAFVITDSFHGTAFSIIYNKVFYSIVNKSRGVSRFESILSDFGLSERLLDSERLEIPHESHQINWDAVNNKRKCLKEESISFLRENLFSNKK